VGDRPRKRTGIGEKSIVGSKAVGARTRPRVVLGAFDDACPYRIQLDVPHCLPQMVLIEWCREEPVRPQVPGPALAAVGPAREAHMSAPDRRSQRVRPVSDNQQVDMVSHEAVRPDLHLGAFRVVREPGSVDLPILGGKEDGLAPVASVGYVISEVRDDYAGEASDGLTRPPGIGPWAPCPGSSAALSWIVKRKPSPSSLAGRGKS